MTFEEMVAAIKTAEINIAEGVGHNLVDCLKDYETELGRRPLSECFPGAKAAPRRGSAAIMALHVGPNPRRLQWRKENLISAARRYLERFPQCGIKIAE